MTDVIAGDLRCTFARKRYVDRHCSHTFHNAFGIFGGKKILFINDTRIAKRPISSGLRRR